MSSEKRHWKQKPGISPGSKKGTTRNTAVHFYYDLTNAKTDCSVGFFCLFVFYFSPVPL